MLSEQSDKPKDVRLVQYLEALASIRSKTVRDINSYEHVLWLGQVPKEPECFSRHREMPLDDDADLWFEIRKPQEPVLPVPPEECKNWIGDWDRNNFEVGPELRETILAPRPAPQPTDDSEEEDGVEQAEEIDEADEEYEPASDPLFLIPDEELHLKDHPEISDQWAEFIESIWTPWAAERLRWYGVQVMYTKLFDMYSYMQTRGEQVELVLADGLLTWRVDDKTIRRHLVVASVDLSFDEKRGRFSIRPHSAGAKLHPEFDMVPPEAQPPSLETTAEQEIRAADDDIWDRATIDQVLKSITNRLSDQGVYSADIRTTDRSPTDKPVVEFAPALILRRRSGRSVHQFLKTIREQVAGGGEVPAGWGDLTERDQVGETSGDLEDSSRGSGSIAETEYYFPLLANDEQQSILRALDHPIGALVQGPPGTGKSHTIANLICHLLATGKRILITAQTPRALQVLKEKLPPEIRPLAVSLLGASAEEKLSLEESVGGITGRFGGKQPEQYREETRDLASKRADVQKRAASLLQQRRSIRERDIMVQSVCGYSGTAEQIAKVLAAEDQGLSWFTDEVPYDDEHEVSTETLYFAVKTLKRLHSADQIRIKKRRPIVGTDFLSPMEFAASVESESASKSAIASLGSDDRESALIDAAELQPMLRDVVTALQTLDVAISNASARPQKWLPSALHEVLTKQDRPWFELHSATEELLSTVRDIAREEDRRTLKRPDDLDWAQICADAKTLRQHLAEGHKLWFWLFKPAPIKACRYLTTDVRLDGSPCATAETLDALIKHSQLHLELGHIWKLWDGKALPSSQSLALQTNEIEELQEALDEVLGAYRRVDEAVEKIAAVPGLAEPEWSSADSRAETLSSLKRRVAVIELASAEGKMSRLKDALSTYGASASADVQSVNRLFAAVEARDTVEYATVCEFMHQLDQDAADLVTAEVTLSGLSKWMPQFASSLGEDPTNEAWGERLPRLSSAINHAKALGWLRDYLDDANLDEIEDGILRCEKRRRELLTKESANLAWAHTFDRMEETHRRALKAWQQAMKALGKGTGRHAPRHRREAQLQLRKSLPAIPAWIMPLHRVFDSIDPFPGMFDVIIVDEASQCGPDALPLFYIGKKILIVGDDKQISPSHVGTPRDHVHQRMREYLDDFEHKGSFDLERSLFDHGDLRMGRPIILREHFRCMPEIIRFSNDLCYSVNPLIPLRQYPPNRLDPLVSRHVCDGYREGGSGHAINKPEAEQVVEAVVKCCRDPRYSHHDEKLTFGVISLLGFKQAEYIEHLLLEAVGAEEMVERRLVCGDAYSFQGDERNVVFLSMVDAQNSPLRARTRFLDYQRYNVAASRAKDQLWLFHSVLPKDLSDQCLRRRLLEHFLDPSRSARTIAKLDVDELRLLALRANRTADNRPPPFDSWFEIDVALRIAARGFRVVPQVESGGKWIDLVVEGLKNRLAVECDGDHWHGPEAYESDLARETKLKRAGWTFVRVRSSSFYANPEAAMQPVWDRLEELGIKNLREDPLEPSDSPDVDDPNLTACECGDALLDEESGSALEADDASEVLGDDALQQSAPVSPVESDAVSSVGVEPEGSDMPGVEPYEKWVPTPMPDPRESSTTVVMEGLVSIVETEGPVLASRAYHLYANAAGLQRVGTALRSVFNKAAWKAKREGRLELEKADDDQEPMLNAILRPAGSPLIRPRTAGGRSMGEIPDSEITWFMQSYVAEQPDIVDDDLYRHILDHYGLKRLRGPTRDRLIEIHLRLLDSEPK